MNVQEAISRLEVLKDWVGDVSLTRKDCQNAIDVAIKCLEMQDKLKQWIEGYKRQEFADMTLTRDGLIDILEEFRLECGE